MTTQIVLYEGTNTVEIHTAKLPHMRYVTQGIENADGTQAAYMPGRVQTAFGLVNDGVRFTPAKKVRGH